MSHTKLECSMLCNVSLIGVTLGHVLPGTCTCTTICQFLFMYNCSGQW